MPEQSVKANLTIKAELNTGNSIQMESMNSRDGCIMFTAAIVATESLALCQTEWETKWEKTVKSRRQQW